MPDYAQKQDRAPQTASEKIFGVRPFRDTAQSVGRHLANFVSVPYHAFADAPTEQEKMLEAMDPIQSLPWTRGLRRLFADPSIQAVEEAQRLRAGGGPQASLWRASTYDPQGRNIPTAGSKYVDAIPIIGPWGRAYRDEVHQKGAMPATAGLLTDVAAAKGVEAVAGAAFNRAPRVLGPGISGLGNFLRDEGIGRINRLMSAGKEDLTDANMGKGYMDEEDPSGISWNMSAMEKKARASAARLSSTREGVLDNATATGMRVPASVMEQRLRTSMTKALEEARSPWKSLNAEELKSHWQDLQRWLDQAKQRGGFTPRELWEAQQHLEKPLDPGNGIPVDLRRQYHTAVKGILEEVLPEMRTLNERYANKKSLADKAEEAKSKGGPAGTKQVAPIIKTLGGAAVGSHFGGTAGTIAGTVLGALADTLPARTAYAAGTHALGRGFSRVGSEVTSLSPLSLRAQVGVGAGIHGITGSGKGRPVTDDKYDPAVSQGEVQRMNGRGGNPQFNGMPVREAFWGVPVRQSLFPQQRGPANVASETIAGVPPAQAMRPRGPEAWMARGANNLALEGIDTSKIAALRQTAQGQQILKNASDLSVGSRAIRSLAQQIR